MHSALMFTLTLGQAIHAAGPRGIPNGHLYAQVMDKCEFDFYMRAIGFLKEKGLCKESNHVLISTLPFEGVS